MRAIISICLDGHIAPPNYHQRILLEASCRRGPSAACRARAQRQARVFPRDTKLRFSADYADALTGVNGTGRRASLSCACAFFRLSSADEGTRTASWALASSLSSLSAWWRLSRLHTAVKTRAVRAAVRPLHEGRVVAGLRSGHRIYRERPEHGGGI